MILFIFLIFSLIFLFCSSPIFFATYCQNAGDICGSWLIFTQLTVKMLMTFFCSSAIFYATCLQKLGQGSLTNAWGPKKCWVAPSNLGAPRPCISQIYGCYATVRTSSCDHSKTHS